ncbi:MAG: hypothetical protein OEW95_02395, partial [Candidatus Bathyarchaeota archaeon]|nr:hypothetical protein [Candidatus Bathyarchaeota archaeon]
NLLANTTRIHGVSPKPNNLSEKMSSLRKVHPPQDSRGASPSDILINTIQAYKTKNAKPRMRHHTE